MDNKLDELSKPVQIFKHPTGRNFWAVMADSTAGQNGVETFREQIAAQAERARQYSVNFRTAERFGLVEVKDAPVVFWFERAEAQEKAL